MLLRVSVFCGSNSTSRRYNSYTILDLRLQMGSRICHPLHLARGNKPGARDDMEPPSVPYEHRAHIFPWSRNACLQVGYNRFIFSIFLGISCDIRTGSCCRRIYTKLIHSMFHLLAVPCIALGFIAVWDYKSLRTNPIPHFYSIHSWLGLGAMGLFTLQVNNRERNKTSFITKLHIAAVGGAVQFPGPPGL